VLVLAKPLWERVVAHCLDWYPMEGCGLLAGEAPPSGVGAPGLGYVEVREVYPATNSARSGRLYTVEPRDLLNADRAAEEAGLALVGVWHSHTHSPPYPSPTDVGQAPDPEWHYVLVSLSDSEPAVRSYRIREGQVTEEPVVNSR